MEYGPVEATINASGTVMPEFEQVLSSPINARVVRIVKEGGRVVSKGEPIVELDVSESVLALEKMSQQVDLKQNQQAKAKLDLENTLISLQSQWEIKNLEYKVAQAPPPAQPRPVQAGARFDRSARSQSRTAGREDRFRAEATRRVEAKCQQSTKTSSKGWLWK